MGANSFTFFAPARCHERASCQFFVSIGFVLIGLMFGCQPSAEPNKAVSPSDSTKASVAGDATTGESDRTKDSTKSQDSTTNPVATKDSESKPASEAAIADSAEEAKRLITDCISNYGVVKSYQDEAVLHLTVQLDKDPILEFRPL
jgi:hypothetical protein